MIDKVLSAEEYHNSILKKEANVCQYISLLAEKHERDLRDRHGKDLFFDPNGADRIIDFFSEIRHYKGALAGQRLHLSDFQKYGFWMLFGWMETKSQLRRYRTVYKEIARKNGKTTEAAGLGLFMLKFDKEAGAQVYTVATKEDQARLCFNDASKLVLTNKFLRDNLRVYAKSIYDEKTFSFMKPLGSDSDTQDGLDPSCAIIDEFHAHPNDNMINVIESGMGSRKQALMYIITTAGFNKAACYDFRDVAIDILNGKKEDDTILPLIFTIDEKDDWTNPDCWIKANPNMDRSINLDFLKKRYVKAINEGGSKEVDFKTKNLDVWTDAAVTWITDATWMRNTRGMKQSDLDGLRCYGGLDLASGIDLNAFALYFPDHKAFLVTAWIPQKKLDNNTDNIDYLKWVQQGWVKVTPGDTIEMDLVYHDIGEIIANYDFRSLAYDRYLATHGILQNLKNDGVQCHEMGQGFVSISTPAKEFEKLATGAEFEHFENPLLRWSMGNCELRFDPAGNIKPDRSSKKKKIDPTVACIFALAEEMTFREDDSLGLDFW